MLKYFKAALTSRWNLLALFGGVGAAVISGSWDVVLPLVLAAEAGYLALVGSNAKFQNYVDMQEHLEARGNTLATQRPGAQAHSAVRCPAR